MYFKILHCATPTKEITLYNVHQLRIRKARRVGNCRPLVYWYEYIIWKELHVIILHWWSFAIRRSKKPYNKQLSRNVLSPIHWVGSSICGISFGNLHETWNAENFNSPCQLRASKYLMMMYAHSKWPESVLLKYL